MSNGTWAEIAEAITLVNSRDGEDREAVEDLATKVAQEGTLFTAMAAEVLRIDQKAIEEQGRMVETLTRAMARIQTLVAADPWTTQAMNIQSVLDEARASL